MRDRLFIQLDPNPAVDAVWLRVGKVAGEAREPAQGSLEQAALEAAGCRVIALVPGVDVLLTSTVVPSRNRQRIMSAVPFLLEEQFANDIDELHFAIGQRESDGRVSVAVVDRIRMDGWLARLRGVGIEPDMIVCESLSLPLEPESWALLKKPDITLVRTGRQSGFVVDTANLETMLHKVLTETQDNRPKQIKWVECNTEDAISVQDLSEFGIEVKAEPYDKTALEFFAEHFSEGETINLVQGNYSRREQLGKLLRPWRPAVAMLVLSVILYGGVAISDYMRLRKESEMLTVHIEKIYLDTFPDAKKVVDPRVQMEKRLEALHSGSAKMAGGFLDLFAGCGDALKQTDGLQLQRVSFRDGLLDLAIVIPDLQGLDQLKQRLSSQSGFAVEIQSATARGNSVEARLQLKSKES